MMKFYTYLHRRADTNEVFYVGKGQAKRAWDLKRRGEAWKNISTEAGGVIVEIYAYYTLETEAFDAERELIADFSAAGVALSNRSIGGEGPSGYVHSAEARANMSAAQRGHFVSEEARANMSKAQRNSAKCAAVRASMIGRPKSEETRAKLSAAGKGRIPPNKGKKVTPETLAKMSAVRLGCKASEETKAKMSASWDSAKRERMRVLKLGTVPSQEAKERMAAAQAKRRAAEKEIEADVYAGLRKKVSAARKGKPLSPEHRAKLSAARRRYVDNRMGV